jgi:hypothetical protein
MRKTFAIVLAMFLIVGAYAAHVGATDVPPETVSGKSYSVHVLIRVPGAPQVVVPACIVFEANGVFSTGGFVGTWIQKGPFVIIEAQQIHVSLNWSLTAIDLGTGLLASGKITEPGVPGADTTFVFGKQATCSVAQLEPGEDPQWDSLIRGQ